jgi:molybdopterin/thiamine biosynthesis adenylyltransferase
VDNIVNMPLSKSESQRYQRQLLVDGWDQEKLKSARVLIVGVGGLGGVSATYLAAVGVGQIRICDSDKVELSNLNRQILFTAVDIAKPKATLAPKKLMDINPNIKIEAFTEKLTESNAAKLVSDCDLIIDGLDNHRDRLILNQASFDLKIPYVYGAINDWQGQVGFFNPPNTACLSCITPTELHSPKSIPVFGALPGVIGSIQATLAIRYLVTGIVPIFNKLLIFQAETMSFETVSFEKKPNCPVCGK